MKQKIITIVALFVMLCMAATLPIGAVDATVSGSNLSGQSGGTVTLKLVLDKTISLKSGGVSIYYDPEIFTYQNCEWVSSDIKSAFMKSINSPKESIDGWYVKGIFAFDEDDKTVSSGDLINCTFGIKSGVEPKDYTLRIKSTLNYWDNGKDDEVSYEIPESTVTVTVTPAPHTCSYTVDDAKPAALKSAGTCKDEAVYYYSCASCGAVEKDDNHTFKGAKDPENHAGTDTETRGAKDTVHTKDALEAGYTGDVYYKCCDAKKEQGTVIPAPKHAVLDEWKYSDTQHWKECSCGKVMEGPVDHTTDTAATCTDRAVCKVCLQEYGNLADHAYTQENKNATGALKSAGTCKDKAVYYYSCAKCGAVEKNDNHTFNGELDSANHSGGTEIIRKLEADHNTQTDGYTGDTKCLGCGNIIKYGESITVTPHTESETWASSEEQHWRTCAVEGCTYEFTKLPHTGGTATCKDKAVCIDCGKPYGEVSSTHNYAEDWSCDAYGHWHVCTVCGAMQEAAKAAHTPDREAPTETEAVKCTVCEYVIEKALGHVCAFDKEVKTAAYLKTAGTCIKPAVYYKSCECGEKSDTLTFEGDVDENVHEHKSTSGYHPANHVKQTAGETGTTICTDCKAVLAASQKIAPSVHRSEKTYAHNSEEHWKSCEYTGCDAEILNTRAAHTYGADGACSVCGYKKDATITVLRGDFNGDGKVTSDDAVYLLKHILFGEGYPLNQSGDFTGDGNVTSDDAVYLLKHIFFGKEYPLN